MHVTPLPGWRERVAKPGVPSSGKSKELSCLTWLFSFIANALAAQRRASVMNERGWDSSHGDHGFMFIAQVYEMASEGSKQKLPGVSRLTGSVFDGIRSSHAVVSIPPSIRALITYTRQIKGQPPLSHLDRRSSLCTCQD